MKRMILITIPIPCGTDKKKGLVMELKDINPFVRFSRFLTIQEHSEFSECCPIDARLFFVESGEGKIMVNDKTFVMPAYSLLFINSGQNYRILPANSVYNAINFDFTQNFSGFEAPIPPVNIKNMGGKTPFERITFSDAPCFDKYCFLPDCYSLRKHFIKIMDTYEKKLPFYRLNTSIELSLILLKAAQKSEKRTQKKDGLNVENIIEYVQNHYCEELNNTELSKIFHFHSNYINSEFKKHTGKSLHGYMLELRILKSISLIESGFTDISEIAHSCGFGDSNYFSRYFKKKTGISPIKYAKQQH